MKKLLQYTFVLMFISCAIGCEVMESQKDVEAIEEALSPELSNVEAAPPTEAPMAPLIIVDSLIPACFCAIPGVPQAVGSDIQFYGAILRFDNLACQFYGNLVLTYSFFAEDPYLNPAAIAVYSHSSSELDDCWKRVPIQTSGISIGQTVWLRISSASPIAMSAAYPFTIGCSSLYACIRPQN